MKEVAVCSRRFYELTASADSPARAETRDPFSLPWFAACAAPEIRWSGRSPACSRSELRRRRPRIPYPSRFRADFRPSARILWRARRVVDLDVRTEHGALQLDMRLRGGNAGRDAVADDLEAVSGVLHRDRKSTRLNSSHIPLSR